ncbi:MAG: flagellar basal body P-ring formation protein FlgA [Gammaproteobacteria bacterium]|nr:flagellar basal body P-ring formation protein FlgA [Gammaproteobacteria bacterium]
MNNIKFFSQYIAFVMLLIFSDVYATEFHSHDVIKKSVSNFLELNINKNEYQQHEIKVDSIDSRLKLVKCDLPLDIARSMGQRPSGRITVGVKCKGKQPWSLYIQASIKISDMVLVTSQSLPVGSMIGMDNVTLVQKDISRLTQGYFKNTQEVEGSFVKRPLASGAVLTASNIRPPNIAERGERVIILAKGNGVVVRMQGQILKDAVAGERVQVKNLLSNQIIEGRIYKKGVVEVAM